MNAGHLSNRAQYSCLLHAEAKTNEPLRTSIRSTIIIIPRRGLGDRWSAKVDERKVRAPQDRVVDNVHRP